MAFDLQAVQSEISGGFLKLADRENKEIYVLAGPRPRVLIWADDGKSVEKGTPEFDALAAKGAEVTKRYQLDVIDLGDGQRKTWEVGFRVVRSCAEALEGNPQSTLRVRRSGVGLSTTYSIMSGRAVSNQEIDGWLAKGGNGGGDDVGF